MAAVAVATLLLASLCCSDASRTLTFRQGPADALQPDDVTGVRSYILQFRPGLTNATTALRRLNAALRGQRQAGARAEQKSISPAKGTLELVHVLGQSDDSNPGGDAQTSDTAPDASAAICAGCGLAVVVKTDPATAAAISASNLVDALFEDVLIQLEDRWFSPQSRKPAVTEVPKAGQAAATEGGTSTEAASAATTPAQATLPRGQLAGNEDVPSGIRMIEAFQDGTMPRLPVDLPKSRQVTVGIIDSGIFAKHPDLNYVGGRTFIKNDGTVESMGGKALRQSDKIAAVDQFGHGTHVAGIVGSKNQGVGIVGVSPGVPLYSLKAITATGQGVLSWLLDAVTWVVRQGKAKYNIRVLNVSMVVVLSPDTPGFDKAKRGICAIFKEASDAGIVVIAAAGNSGESIEGYFPAACPTVATVTALDAEGRAPSGYSNYWPSDATSSDKQHTYLAPGTAITSTVPQTVDSSGYYQLSGTSQAAPHVTGIVANCLLAKACPMGPQATALDSLNVVSAAAASKAAAVPAYAQAERAAAAGRFYGPVVWSKF